MIEPIGDLISECFYDKRLKSPVKSHGLKLDLAFPKPVTWYSTHELPNNAERQEGQTFQNIGEVREIRQILRRLQFVAKGQKQRAHESPHFRGTRKSLNLGFLGQL